MPSYPRAYASAAETLRELDRWITDSGIEPTARVAGARAEIAAVADDERDLLAEVDRLIDPDPGTVLESAADAFTNRRVTAAEALDQLAASTRSTAKQRQHLRNSTVFRTSRRAAVILRKLGDGLLDDIAAPWMERLVADLHADAMVVAEHGQPAVYAAREWATEHDFDPTDGHRAQTLGVLGGAGAQRHLAVLRAEVKVAQLRNVWDSIDDLRDRGFLPGIGDQNVSPLRYRWSDPLRLPDLAAAHREPWWTCTALAHGAGPVVRTAAQAEAFTPVAS